MKKICILEIFKASGGVFAREGIWREEDVDVPLFSNPGYATE